MNCLLQGAVLIFQREFDKMAIKIKMNEQHNATFHTTGRTDYKMTMLWYLITALFTLLVLPYFLKLNFRYMQTSYAS